MESHILHQLLDNATFLDKRGAPQHLSKYDIVLLYFSAHWCPPCREFTPRLKSFYEKLPKGSVKIVFVSGDKSKEEFTSYFNNEHGDWLAIDYHSNRQAINQMYQIKGIPALLLINNKTAYSCMNQDILRNHITNPSTNHVDVLRDWEKACESPYRLNLGREVRILYLKSKPELNGKSGKVVGWKEKRSIVRIDSNIEIAIKRENLFPVGIRDKKSSTTILKPLTEDRTEYLLENGNNQELTAGIESLEFDIGTPVVLRNLSTTKWNGEGGVVQSVMEDGKYLVYMNSQEILKIKHSNLFV